jgi:hypothetical protein
VGVRHGNCETRKNAVYFRRFKVSEDKPDDGLVVEIIKVVVEALKDNPDLLTNIIIVCIAFAFCFFNNRQRDNHFERVNKENWNRLNELVIKIVNPNQNRER